MKAISIAGAGVGGMTAAFLLASKGYPVKIYEKCKTIGGSRHGDFEGIENWIYSTPPESFFSQLHLPWAKLDKTSVYEFSVHTGLNSPYQVKSSQPFFHMIRRGGEKNDLDTYLYELCLEKNVEFFFNQDAPECMDIVATGSKNANAYIQGISFKTELKNQVHLLLGDTYAPKGYAYLIILNGRGTLASAFKKSKYSTSPLENSLQYFNSIGLPIPKGGSFAGRGSFSFPIGNTMSHPYLIGERGGFQDFLFGFGIRMAMASGQAVAYKIMGLNLKANRLMKEINRKRKLSYMNRILYERLTDKQKLGLTKRFSQATNPLKILSQIYQWNIRKYLRLQQLKREYEIRFS